MSLRGLVYYHLLFDFIFFCVVFYFYPDVAEVCAIFNSAA